LPGKKVMGFFVYGRQTLVGALQKTGRYREIIKPLLEV
jgi:hypothetical protein